MHSTAADPFEYSDLHGDAFVCCFAGELIMLFFEHQALVLILHSFWDFGPKVQQFT